MSDVSIRAVARNIFRWAKTVNRKTPSKRFGCRPVLSKNLFGALRSERFGVVPYELSKNSKAFLRGDTIK